MTLNFWSDDFFDNGWVEHYSKSGKGIAEGVRDVEIYTDQIDLQQSFKAWLHQFDMIYYKEGLNGVVTVYQKPDGDRFLKINGKSDASSTPLDMRTQLLLGYVPLFLQLLMCGYHLE